VNALVQGLKATAEGFVRKGSAGAIRCEITAYMRYVGQGWEIPVTLPDRPFSAADADLLRRDFQQNYARFFGRAIDGLDGLEIEIVTFSVKAQDSRPAPHRHALTLGETKAGDAPVRPVFDPARGAFLPTAIVERSSLAHGARLEGPAVVVERETSTVVTSLFDCVMQGDGSLLLVRKGVQA
jgi:N-methylhydantoinase A